MSKGGSKQQTVTQSLDPATQQQQQRVYDAANQAATLAGQGFFGNTYGLNQNTLNAGHVLNGMSDAGAAGDQALRTAADAGRFGTSALEGNSTAIGGMMNPYINQVINPMLQRYSDLTSRLNNNIASQATGAGAYGGSRAAVAQGVADADLARSSAQDIGSLYSQGFNTANQNAQTLAGYGLSAGGALGNLGLGTAQQFQGLGDYERQAGIESDPNLLRMHLLQGSLQGMPYGQTTSQPVNHGSAGSGFLGGAATGASIGSAFGPWGTGIGAGIGGLIGLF